MSKSKALGVWVDSCAVVVAWGACGFAENVAVGLLWRDQFSGAWEIDLARKLVVPLAVALFAPASLVASRAFRIVLRIAATGDRRLASVLAAVGALLAGALGYGVTGGRHFASWGFRGAVILLIASMGAWVSGVGAARLVRAVRIPLAIAAIGIFVTCASWLADGYVLPRLYPTFHDALFGCFLFGATAVAIALRGDEPPSMWSLAGAAAVTAALVFEWLSLPRTIAELDQRANLRIALVEHAPMAGRAIQFISKLRREEPARLSSGTTVGIAPGDVARTLDWSGHDIVLISIDALRADHVSAYGYGRAITPNIDGLARDGTLFESAYCPTPHTSYSVTSMLTGKYMRPLLALGLGSDSETWAQALRRYGYRTAAFYPPAVFFIDEEQFRTFETSRLGFEYAKVEFADPELRERQVEEYLSGAPPGVPMFLWVHFFEPHEPYVVHPEHVFTGGSPPEIDAYDSEVATADDGVGRILRVVRAHRPGAVVMVTADHGEEFGEHGGRYHGTTVYEEQVRVPLVIDGPMVRRGVRERSVVQTIDLFPTVLSALGIPRPARVRGRDLGSLLVGDLPVRQSFPLDSGFAFAETDDYALIAEGEHRLVCARRAAACALYRPQDDPRERRDVASTQRELFDGLRASLRSVELEFGRYERGEGRGLPEALRRGIQGDIEAAPDVVSLLDDADVSIRRKAAEVCFDLRSKETLVALRRSSIRDDDDEVRRWAKLALVRMGDADPDSLGNLGDDAAPEWRRRVALVRAERGDVAGCDELSNWWSYVLPPSGMGTADGEPPRLSLDLRHVREILEAASTAHCRSMVPGLIRGLSDVRARRYVSDVLGALGDPRARDPLLGLLARETNETSRAREAEALLALGMQTWASAIPSGDVRAKLPVSRGSQLALIFVSDPSATLEVRINGSDVPVGSANSSVRSVELPAHTGPNAVLEAHVEGGTVRALWIASDGGGSLESLNGLDHLEKRAH